MIDMIKNWALTLAIAAVIVAVVEGLAPKGKLEKVIKITSGIFLSLVMVSPLTMLLGIDFSASAARTEQDVEASETIQLEVRDKVLSITRDNLRQRLEGVLLRKTGYSILVSFIGMHEEDGLLSVDRVELVMPDGAPREDAEFAVRVELGDDVEVVISTEGR